MKWNCTEEELERRRNNWSGERNPNFRNIDKNYLKHLIKKGMTVEEIKTELSISTCCLYYKMKKFWNMTITEAREKL